MTQRLHPGPTIRLHIMVKGMTVGEAADKLGVGRPALSNMLNARAALSPELAYRIEQVFGISMEATLCMQACHDAHLTRMMHGA